MYHYLVAYDISDPARLRKVHRICSDHGIGIQFSIFACQLSEQQYASLRALLESAISTTEDQVLFLRVKKVSKNATSKKIPGVDSIGRKIRWGESRAIIV